MYERIDGAHYRQIYIVGDLHGCYDLFEQEMAAAGMDKTQDLVLSVGDLVDRGAQNLQCLALLTQPWFKAVRGNHEMLMFGALNNETEDSTYWWRVNGGCWDELLTDEQNQTLRALAGRIPDLPFIIHLQLEKSVVVVAHADYPDDHYVFGKQVDPQGVIWNRTRIADILAGEQRSIAGADLFVFGHTIMQTPLPHNNLMYIDTGAVGTGTLTVVRVK